MKTITILSLGAGVQSSTILLMACQGELPKPDAAVFADTGWEPQAVYDHLAWLETQARVAGIPIYRVATGNLKDDLLREVRGEGTGRVGHIGQPPFYVKNTNQFTPEVRIVPTLWGDEAQVVSPADRGGRLWRKCTQEYKLIPIRRRSRALMREAEARHVDQWIGISTDEAHRVKPSGVRYITNRYPLLDKGMSRQDCLRWVTARGYSLPPKSSCLGCPFHSDAYWVQLREDSPTEWAETVVVDQAIRHGIPGVRGAAYMHRSCVPLDEVQFHPRPEKEEAQLCWDWTAECEGICGV